MNFFLYRSEGEFSSPSSGRQHPEPLKRSWMALILTLNLPSLCAIHYEFTPKGQQQNVSSAPVPCWTMFVGIAEFFDSICCTAQQTRSSSCCSRELHSRHPTTSSEPMRCWRVPRWLAGGRTKTLAWTHSWAGQPDNNPDESSQYYNVCSTQIERQSVPF